MEGTIGEIRLFAANFAPQNWAYCNGQLIPIRSNTALYSILGTTYGGDGQNTFALPNFNGRTAIGAGNGPGLSSYKAGETVGRNNITLQMTNLPPHTHVVNASLSIPAYSEDGDSAVPAQHILAGKANMYTQEEGDISLGPIGLNTNISPAGGNIPINITQPSIGMNYIICLYGMFPSRP